MHNKYIVFLFLLLTLACNTEPQIESATATALFAEKNSTASGLSFSNNLNPTSELNILEYLYYYNGGGVAVGDINSDGLEDVILTANQGQDKLFLNQGDLKFTDITNQSGIKTNSDWSSGVSMDDVNGDGLLDIYVCKVAPISGEATHNELYINNGDATFTESAGQYGLDFSGYSTQASFFDYDRDGDLDMYLLNHSVHSVRSYGKISKRNELDELSGDRLYENRLNEAEAKFVDVSAEAGIYSSALGYGLCVITADINNDGWTDIYVGNDFHENDYVYLNNQGQSFKESMPGVLNHCSKFTMGVDITDMNNDGLQDIFTTDMLPYDEVVALKSGGEDTDQVFKIRSTFGFEDQYARNHLQLQMPDHQFSDIALMTNTYATDWSWSVLLQDFDNDTRNDIFITNGIVKRPNDLDYIKFVNTQNAGANERLTQAQLDAFLSKMPAQKLKNILFTQDDDLSFSELTNSTIGSPTFSNGAAYADFDKDGDLDLIVNNINAEATLLANSTKGNNYVSISLINANTAQTSKDAIVKVYTGELIKTQQYVTTRGYQSSSSHYLHFGLGDMTTIDSVVVIWPDRTKEVFKGLALNQLHEIKKGADTKPYVFSPQQAVAGSLEQLQIRHIENKFDDYNADKLIPELLSREGPAVVYEDFDQDGQKDLFFGGARYQEPRLFLRKAGEFVEQKGNLDFKKDAKYEDVDAAVIDFDKDGDLDLYVVSGGNDEKELNKQLEDRIYLNDGKGNLKRLPLSLPHTNGSSIAVADFDGDGFEDIFIGARSIPSSYGLSPYSFLLKNKGGFGVDIALKERLGLLTDSKWADIDGDQDIDLVFCGDWMNIGVLVNQGDGTFQLQSDELGLGQSAGLWNTIYLEDLNQDGQLDIIAGNAGANFKWKASPEKPVKLYVMDMDENGQTEPLIFYPYFSTYLPFTSMDELVSQVPSVRKQFVTYDAFSSVQDIKDFQQIKAESIVERKQIKELRSMVYLSENGKYEGKPLPFNAQLSTIQEFSINDEGNLLFVGNYHDYLTELGKNTANSGGMYKDFNAATGTFENYQQLPLPANLNTRGILPMGKDEYLISVNNDTQYILRMPK